MQVEYTLYEDYLVAVNQRQSLYPRYTAPLSDLLLLDKVIKGIVHDDAWFLPGCPEFEYGCVVNIRGRRMYYCPKRLLRARTDGFLVGERRK